MTGDEPAGDREAALVEFQTTMQRFLEAQERIMFAYLTGGERHGTNATGLAAGEVGGICTGRAAADAGHAA